MHCSSRSKARSPSWSPLGQARGPSTYLGGSTDDQGAMYVPAIMLTYAGIWLEDQILVYLGRHKTQFRKYLQSRLEQRVCRPGSFRSMSGLAAVPEIPTYHSLLLLPTGLSALNNDF